MFTLPPTAQRDHLVGQTISLEVQGVAPLRYIFSCTREHLPSTQHSLKGWLCYGKAQFWFKECHLGVPCASQYAKQF